MKRHAGCKRLEQQVRRFEKKDAIGQSVGVIAHDFNNSFAIIMGNLELLRLRAKRDPKNLEYVDAALEATKRAAGTTKKLLGFARQKPKDAELTG